MPSGSFRVFPVVAFVFVVLASGCGESKQDLFLKAAQRPRPSSDDDQKSGGAEKPVATNQQTQPQPSNTNPPANRQVVATPVAAQQQTDNGMPIFKKPEVDLTALAEELGIKPISERKPEKPLSEAARRKRSYENIAKISEAIMLYVAHNHHYPQAAMTANGGLPTLSWRVAILPYLGYEKLYAKFDANRSWNMPPNKQLLEFIPDEFVSPERFDTKTNYLVPVESHHMFGNNRKCTANQIDDGDANTLMLIEVGDNLAANWSEPKEISFENGKTIQDYVHKVRSDGTFAVWASGLPTLIEKNVAGGVFDRALSWQGNDGFLARTVHRTISVEEIDDDIAPDDPDLNTDGSSTVAAMPNQAPMVVEESELAREPVPSSLQLAGARDKLRRIFADKLAEADDRSKKAALGQEMIDMAAEMQTDPAGAYALQGAALKLANDSGDADLLLRTIDQRVVRFDIDTYEENTKWIQAFGSATASRDSRSVMPGGIVNRCLAIAHNAIHRNEFSQGSAMARLANRYTGMARTEPISRLLNRLQVQLGVASREYDKSKEHLADYRIDPKNTAAGAAFGQFLCFIKGDWKTGLPLIAEHEEGGDLTEVVRMDLRGSSDSSGQIAIADAWWDLSKRANGVYQQGAQDRAIEWYRTALAGLSESLDKLHVENRIAEADESDGRSPLALCQQLSEELGVDLSVSLTTLAVQGGRSGRHHRDDDDD